MSRARAKGTRGENYFLEVLRRLFSDRLVERAPLKGTYDYGDFIGVPWLHEAKNTQKPLFQQWARKCRYKAGEMWVLLWQGDRRTVDGQPLVLMPLRMYEFLVDHRYRNLTEGEKVRAAHEIHVGSIPEGATVAPPQTNVGNPL